MKKIKAWSLTHDRHFCNYKVLCNRSVEELFLTDVIFIYQAINLSQADIDYLSLLLQIISCSTNARGEQKYSRLGIPFGGIKVILAGDIL